MGVPSSEVGYTSATTRRETTKSIRDMWWHWIIIIKKLMHNVDIKIKLVFICVGSAGGPKSSKVALQLLQKREDDRLTRLMLTIFCCFLVCFLPLMLVNVADDKVKKNDVCTSFSAVDTLFRL
jgi:hypothetical protein